MSATFLEIIVGVIAAVLVFLFALRAVPLVIEYLSHYFDRTIDSTDLQDKEPYDDER
jgi:hypothetical protein